jgi:hypothetical protein
VQREPRLEKRKHLEADRRLRTAILEGKDYPGKEEDFALLRRKRREGRAREVNEMGDSRGGGGLT